MSDCDNKCADEETASDGDCVKECEQSFKNHEALCEVSDKTLDELLTGDSLLSDIPYDVSYEEVLAQIAVVKGQSIALYIKRGHLSTLKVFVSEKNATVLDLKKAIRRAYENEERRSRKRELISFGHRYSKSSRNFDRTNISWRYIWRTYVLDNDKQPLIDDTQLLSSYGVVNKSILTFVKRSKIEKRQRHLKKR